MSKNYIQPLQFVQVPEHTRLQDRYFVVAQITKRVNTRFGGQMKESVNKSKHQHILFFTAPFCFTAWDTDSETLRDWYITTWWAIIENTTFLQAKVILLLFTQTLQQDDLNQNKIIICF